MRMLFLAVFVSLVGCGTSPTGEEGESGTRYQISETAKEVRQGVELIIRFDDAKTAFVGTVKNTTSSDVEQVRVEVHLSNGTELGPTPRVELKAGETKDVLLEARGQSFTWYSVHVELGSGDHGSEGGD